ncbi:type IV secretory system conjugative DNA transfer family protein [Prevotella melaninogenica]|uniref:Type IV secretory system conjugative DNA transfer family protein n=1 Tax=Prevotella melaninogenica TaxID=28132 RepID=A0ABS6Y9X5_9BACT|nr:type IV secretory system conjugative DNA transfer family protein [Prevotella melaninogenica]MBW4755451.1 type IV secretory system conjugative DNA transfer family protein [Prevotella melaninogenica]
MEESKEIQSIYKIFRMSVYISIGIEFFMYALDPVALDYMNGILVTFHEKLRTIPIYNNIVLSKLTTLVLLCVASMGTKAKKNLEFNAKKMVIIPLSCGLVMVIASIIIFYIEGQTRWYHIRSTTWIYMAPSLYGVMMMNVALDNISKFFKDGLIKDKFNFENESFKQMENKDENRYSVNIPMRYYYRGKFRHGFVNIVNPFRGTFVVGTPGSGKTFSVIEPFIRQHSEKGFAMVVYDYKFPTLATKLYYQYRKNQHLDKVPEGCQFNIINFVNIEYSRRVNPIQQKYIPNLAAASETAETLLESLQKGKKDSGGADQFFQTSATNFLAACIYFFVNYDKKPYDEDGNELVAEYKTDKDTLHRKLTGRVFKDNTMQEKVQPAFWLGKYSDMPHVLSFLNHSYEEIFEVLKTDPEVYPLLASFVTAFENKAMDQLEGMIGTLRVQISRLATKEAYWVFSGDDFDLKVSDPKHPSYLLIANDPDMESIIGALNAMILNRLVTRVNSGMGKNVPVSIIADELPTLYFHKIDRLIGTARSNKVAVTLGFQELPQLEADYGKTGMQKIITTNGNIIAGSARAKETLDWLSNDIFGKVVQMKKGVTIDRDKTSINYNENVDSLVPAAKISDLPTGWICGLTARDFTETKTGRDGSMNIQESKEFETAKFFCKTNFDMEKIKEEEADYKNYPIPKYYEFESTDARERVLYANFERINQEVKEMVGKIQKEFVKK